MPLRSVKRTKPPRPPLRHRRDGSTLLGLLVLVFGLAWLAAGTHLFRVPVEAVVAVALMVLGGTLVITARTDWALSRRKWPVLVGVGLVLALAVGSVSPRIGLRHLSFGSNTVVAANWTDVPDVIEGRVGRMVVDLSGLPGAPPTDTTLQVDGNAGSLVVHLPPNVHTVLDVELTAGRILVNGDPVATGFQPTYNQSLEPSAPGPTLTLKVTGVGSVEIDNSGVSPVPVVPVVPMPPDPTVTTA